MYTRFFGLHQVPFSIAPDPRYLFMSERHREALAHLLYGLDGGGGFVLLTGEIGAGKTTVCRLFLEQIPAQCNFAYIFNPKQTVIELLQSICDEFGVAVPAPSDHASTIKDFIDPLNAFLLASHGRQQNNVLIIDEAQNLSADVLEQLRLLTNLETNQRKLLQIILIGQPELRGMLAQPELEQLAQRIIARFHLAALSAEETAQYIAHRLAVAGMMRASPFSARVMRRIHSKARGIPRRINLLCDRALLGAYASGRNDVDARTVDLAAREVFDLKSDGGAETRTRWQKGTAGAVVAVLALTVAGVEYLRLGGTATAPRQPAVAGELSSTKPSTAAVTRSSMTTELVIPVATAGQAPGSSAVPAGSAPQGGQGGQGGQAASGGGALGQVAGVQARDLPQAYQRLAQLWGLTIAQGDACQAVQAQNVYCFTGRNGLVEIRLLDRPGIMTLHDDDDQKYYALLVGLSNQAATLRIGDRTETVALAALAKRWRGGFMTLWRGPAGFKEVIATGDRGLGADWLAMRLAKVNGTTEPAANAIFDKAMASRVREFQLTQGLIPDAVAGPQTLMRLASMAGEPEPHLQAGK